MQHMLEFVNAQGRLFGDPILPDGWRLVPLDAGLCLPTSGLLAAHADGRIGVAVGSASASSKVHPMGYPWNWSTTSDHRIICATFHGPPPFDGAQVRHLDGNPKNNQAANLAWGTASENAADTIKHGKHPSRRVRERVAQDLYFSIMKGPLVLWNWGLVEPSRRRALIAARRIRDGLAKRGPFGNLPRPAPPAPTLPGFDAWPPDEPGVPDWPPSEKS